MYDIPLKYNTYCICCSYRQKETYIKRVCLACNERHVIILSQVSKSQVMNIYSCFSSFNLCIDPECVVAAHVLGTPECEGLGTYAVPVGKSPLLHL